MTDAVVIDASVALKWVIAEELSNGAHSFLEDCRRFRHRIVAPPHLHSEVANALHQRFRRKDLSEDETDEALANFSALGIQIIAPPDLYQKALTIARGHQLPSIYDALYVSLADTLKVDLWTDDQRLLKALRTALPWVRAIADYGKGLDDSD